MNARNKALLYLIISVLLVLAATCVRMSVQAIL